MQPRDAAQCRALALLAERAPELAASLQRATPALATGAQRALAYSGFLLDALCRDPVSWQRLLDTAGAELAAVPLPSPELPPDDAALPVAEQEALSWRRCGAGGAPSSRASPGATWPAGQVSIETLADLSHAAEVALQLRRALCDARARAALRPAALGERRAAASDRRGDGQARRRRAQFLLGHRSGAALSGERRDRRRPSASATRNTSRAWCSS